MWRMVLATMPVTILKQIRQPGTLGDTRHSITQGREICLRPVNVTLWDPMLGGGELKVYPFNMHKVCQTKIKAWKGCKNKVILIS